MSEILRDVSKIWDRLFDHKAFLSGEIDFTLKEFEEKRGEKEVDKLFSTLENITDIKDTQIDRLKEAVNEKSIEINQQLSEALKLCSEFTKLEENYLQTSILEENRAKRADLWGKFMDDITTEYSKINAEIEEKEIEATELYKDLEKRLKL